MPKVCILAAGIGSRNKCIEGLHKALLPLNNKPVISHIIDSFPQDMEIVIALGYKQKQLLSYLEEVHTSKNITYVTVDNFDKSGSGPGYSLYQCKNHLQEPFIFTSVDTLLDEFPVSVDSNWIGTSNIDEKKSSSYCLVSVDNETVKDLYYGSGNLAFVGTAGVKDYKTFWNNLEKTLLSVNEIQVIPALQSLTNIKAINSVWYDTGNIESYYNTKKVYNNDIVAPKNNETIFLDNNLVIKYFSNSKKNLSRVERVKFLNDCTPDTTYLNDNMYCYEYINGALLSNITNVEIMREFFSFCDSKLWLKKNRDDIFISNCRSMYEFKTKSRINELIDSDLDKIRFINGLEVQPIRTIYEKIGWGQIYNNALPVSFHGDLQPENIIYNNERFFLIDWRESFGNSLEVGDIYYDLSKLYHGLDINGTLMNSKNYFYNIEDKSANIGYNIKSNLIDLKDTLKTFVIEKGLDWYNIRLLGALHYLNICTLYKDFHNGEYGRFLFLYSKYLLQNILQNK